MGIGLIILAKNKVIKRVIDKLSSIKEIEEIYLFGSVARGDYTPFSDLDFFVVTSTKVPKYKLREIAADIYVEFGVPVTIIGIVRGQKTPLFETVKLEGKMLWRRERR